MGGQPWPDPGWVEGGHLLRQWRDLGPVRDQRQQLHGLRPGGQCALRLDLFTLLKDLEGRGLLSSSDILWQVNFGFEICSTGGRQASFSVTHYSLNSTPSS